MNLNQLLNENDENQWSENDLENLSELQLSYKWLQENGFENLLSQFEKNQKPIDICTVLKSSKNTDVLALLRNVDILNNSLHKSPKSNSTVNTPRPSSLVGYTKYNQSSSIPPENRRLSHHIPNHCYSNILMETNQYENTNSKPTLQSNPNTNINNKQNQQNISTNYKTSNKNRLSKFSNTQSIKEELSCSSINSTNESGKLIISSPISFKQVNTNKINDYDLNQNKSVALRRKKLNHFFPMINSKTVPKISFSIDNNGADSDSDNSRFLTSNYRDYYDLNSNSSCNDDLCNDSIDFGDSGRLNFRTGSFMTRYRRSSNKISLQSSSNNLDNERKAGKGGLGSKNSTELLTGSIDDELDPVLNSLKNDINSLDDFRKLINKHDDLRSRSSQKSLHLNTNEMSNQNRLSSPSLISGNEESSKENNSTNAEEKDDDKESDKNSSVILASSQSTLNKSTNSNNTKMKKGSFKKSLSTRKRNHPFRWSSLARSTISNQNQGSSDIQDLQLYRLSIGQLYHLKRVAMLKLTSMLQMHGCNSSSKYQFNWKFPKLLSGGSSKSTKLSSSNSLISAAEIVSSASPPVSSNLSNPLQEPESYSAQSITPSSAAGVQFSLETPSSPSSPTPVKDSSSSSSSECVVFGKSLEYWQNRIGQPLPPVIYHAMKHIRVLGPSCDGIFRRAGGKARTNELKRAINENPKFSDFSNWQPYDVADMLKSFFRSLPECLIPTKFTTSLVSAFIHLREELWLEAIKCVIICMPDENRLVLQSVLYFLADLSNHSEVNQMNSFNLSVCLAPSLFHTPNLFHQSTSSSVSPMRILKQHHHNQGPDPKELEEQKAIQVMLNLMIKHSSSIFKVSCDKFNLIPIPFDLPISLNKLLYHKDLQSNQTGSTLWLQARLTNLVTEHLQKLKHWTVPKKEITKRVPAGLDIYFRKISSNFDDQELDGISGLRLLGESNIPMSARSSGSSSTNRIPGLYTWKIITEIHYDPHELFDTILYKRHIWDPEVQEWSISQQISTNIDLCEEEHSGCPPEPSRKINLLRGWKKYSLNQDNTNLIGCMVTQSVTLQPQRLAPQKATHSTEVQPTVPPILPNIIRDDVILELVLPPASHTNSSSVTSSSSVSSVSGVTGCKCKLHWISRVDMRGYNHDWYYRHWYYVLIRRIVNLKQHLHLNPDIK